MARTMLTLTSAAALIYLALCAALFIFQRSLIYYPQPRSLGPGTSMFTLPVDGALLVVTTRPLQGPTQDLQAKGALIYFGGNAEDVSYSLPGLAAAFPGHAVYLMHYRGYGGSTGTPSEAALFAHDLHRCPHRFQLSARAVALIYNWWSLFVRLAHPEARREAITSRPWLMASVGRRTEHAGQTTITLTGLHAHFAKARAALMRTSALLKLKFRP